jgi:hypothetical protein
MIPLLFLVQAAAAQQPDIELHIQARARSVEIRQKGEAKLEVRGEGAGHRVEARVEPKAEGHTQLRNVTVDIRAQASVNDGLDIRATAETRTPN